MRSIRIIRHEKEPERGATAVEGAIVAPVFLALIFACIELGLYLYHSNSLQNAGRDGAREASTWAASPLADYNILRTVKRDLGSLVANTDAVIIYRASSATSPVPGACLSEIGVSRGVAGSCNVYTANDLTSMNVVNFGYVSATPDATKWDRNWPATDRNEEITGDTDPDMVGVYIQVRHDTLSGIVSSQRIHKTSIIQIEPQRAG